MNENRTHTRLGRMLRSPWLLLPWFLLMCWSAYALVVEPAWSRLEHGQRKELEMRQVFERKQRQATSLDALILQQREVEQQIGRLVQKLPGRLDTLDLREQMLALAAERGVGINRLSFGESEDREFYAETPVELDLVGSYQGITSLARELAGQFTIMTPHTVRVMRADDGRAKLESTMKVYRFIDEQD